jgi:hypothetical protein
VAAYPIPTPIFHITAIDNLASIASCGTLLAKNVAAAQGLVSANIAYEEIQGRRAVKVIPIYPGGTLHDYVPFYFAPRSPMLMTINSGNVAGCDYRQDDIVHLVSTAQAVHDGGHRFVFSDLHAAKDFAEFFGDLSRLDEIEWPLFFEAPLLAGYCKFWQNRHNIPRYVRRLEIRQAEFLIYQQLPIAAVCEVGVRTQQGETRIRAALHGTGWTPTVRVIPGWYY